MNMIRNRKMNNSRLEGYIRSYQELLAEKGYTEFSLGSGTAPGTLGANIEKGLRKIVELSEDTEEGQGVMVKTFGKFGDNKDAIGFDFVFAYNPSADTINLELMRISDDMVQMTCIPKLSSLIPDLQTAIQLFKEERMKLLLQQMQQPLKRPGRRRL